ncbi:MAG: LysR family transcriptional regulator [Archangium sp.]
MDLELLPSWGLFALAVRHQSFAEAARRAGVTRSAVSQRIARLEAHLGVELLRRTTRKVAPTAHGLALFEAAQRLLDDASALDDAGTKDREEAPLRINAPGSLMAWSTLLGSGLTTILTAFRQTSPGPLELSLENRPIDLFETKDDVVIRVARSLPPGVIGRKLGTDEVLCVAAPAYVEKHGQPETPQALMRHRCLRYRPTAADVEWRFTAAKGAPFSVPVTAHWTVDDGITLLQLVRAGEGIAVMPGFMLRSEIAAGHLVRLLPTYKLATLEIWALLPAGRKSPPRARAFVDFLARRFKW